MDKILLIGVTGCPVGVAHTYAAAKALQKAANKRDIEMIVETNGSIGVENSPTDDDIARATAVIIASDKQVEVDRFTGKPVLFVGTKDAIRHADDLITQLLSGEVPIYKTSNVEKETKTAAHSKTGAGVGSTVYKAVMNGVSHMVPFVILGGLLIAVALALGGKPTPQGLQIPPESFWQNILNIGVVGFKLMIPILAGYIAYSIADRPALVAGMVGGWIASDGSFYNSTVGAGFLGALVAGLMAGYIVLALKRLPWNKYIKPLVPIMIIPIISTLLVGLSFIFIIGAPISSMMAGLNQFLVNLSAGNLVMVGIALGLMQGFDLGGPVAKVAFLFCVGLLADGQPQFMGALACSIPVAPMGMGLASFWRPHIFGADAKENGIASFAMSLVGISEGAIPFAVSHPLMVLPATMLGSAVASTLGFLWGIENSVAHGGPVVALLGAMNKPLLALFAMFIGAIITAVAVHMLSFIMQKKNTKLQGV